MITYTQFTTCPSCRFTAEVGVFMNPEALDAFKTEIECPKCGCFHIVWDPFL